jgi:hypothetical protein
LVIGQRSTRAAVRCRRFGGSGCFSSGVIDKRLLPFLEVRILTFGLAGRVASSVVRAASICRRRVAMKRALSCGCARASY